MRAPTSRASSATGWEEGRSVAAGQAVDGFSPVQCWWWSVRRELWENRWLWLGPVSAAVLFLVGVAIGTYRLPAQIAGWAGMSAMARHEAIGAPYHVASGFLMLVAMFVGAFYCVDALQGERRDRSILFWKSLPVSDTTAVLAKASIPFLYLPCMVFGLSVLLHVLMFAVESVVLGANGFPWQTLGAELSLPRMEMLLGYHLFTVHVLWEAPIYAWLLLVSAWAKRAALVWAVLPPLAIFVLERLVFGTTRFVDLLANRVSGSGTEAMLEPGTFPMDAMTHPTLVPFLLTPGLWIGLLCTAAFLWVAIRLRRERGPSA